MINYQICCRQDLEQAIGSFLLTFIFVLLPLVPYMFIANLALARIISIITGLVLLFILGVHQAQLEHNSPLRHGFVMAMIGAACAYIFYFLAKLII
jgi:VIT1/CCC1 family predicted Fe2+/Mn2+ transporter